MMDESSPHDSEGVQVAHDTLGHSPSVCRVLDARSVPMQRPAIHRRRTCGGAVALGALAQGSGSRPGASRQQASASPTLVVVDDDALTKSRKRHELDALYAIEPTGSQSGVHAFVRKPTERGALRS